MPFLSLGVCDTILRDCDHIYFISYHKRDIHNAFLAQFVNILSGFNSLPFIIMSKVVTVHFHSQNYVSSPCTALVKQVASMLLPVQNSSNTCESGRTQLVYFAAAFFFFLQTPVCTRNLILKCVQSLI
jgi:hypothetical protein